MTEEPDHFNGCVSKKELTRRADEGLLASLGYKQEFKRAFTPCEVFGIAFSIIGLLPSIASVLFYAIPNGGGPAMVWGWAVASFFILLVGLSMAELASAAPTSGGLYFWTYNLSSPRWRNLLCWIVGYANTIGSIASVASIDWGCAVQVTVAATIGSGGKFEATKAQTSGIYVALLLLHAAICCLGTTVLARLQTIYIILNIQLCLAVIVALPIATPVEFRNTAKFALWEFTNFNGWTDGYAFLLSFLAPIWTIGSFDSSVHISEEASNAAIAVPWAIVMAIAIAGILGWAINMSLAFCMGTNLQALSDSPQPMAQIFLNSFGQKGTLAVWFFVILAQFMMGSSMLLAASRQTFAFSRDSALPFSKWLYRMNRYSGTPVNAVWFDVIFALLLGLLAFAGNQAINAVFSLSIAALYIAYAIPIMARFLGDNDFKPGPFSLGIFSLLIAVASVLFMMFFVIVVLFPGSPKPAVGNMNYTVVVLTGVMVLSLLWYYFPRYGGVHWFTGPVSNISLSSASTTAGLIDRDKIQHGTLEGDFQPVQDVNVNPDKHISVLDGAEANISETVNSPAESSTTPYKNLVIPSTAVHPSQGIASSPTDAYDGSLTAVHLYSMEPPDPSMIIQEVGQNREVLAAAQAHLIKPPTPPPDTNIGYHPQLDQRRPETIVEYLKNYHVVFVIDDSSSMRGWRWNETRDALLSIAEYALKEKVNEVDIRFFNNPLVCYRVKGAASIEAIFAGVQPSYGTPMGAALKRILNEHIVKLDRAINTPQYCTIKPLVIIMLTDGIPSDRPKDVLVDAVARIKAAKHHPNAIGVQIVQIDNDDYAVPILEDLMYGDVGNIVDIIPYDGRFTPEKLERILLGGLHANVRAMVRP